MKKVVLLAMCLLAAGKGFCSNATDELLSLINMKPDDVTPDKVSSLLGQPEQVKESKKQNIWYYTKGNASFTIYWNANSLHLEKYSFTYLAKQKPEWNDQPCRNLRIGETCVAEAVKALGTPKDMTVRKMNQELHYSYQYNVLNLFFRKDRLVNYTLY